jgi:ribosomal protein L11 methyltransferase
MVEVWTEIACEVPAAMEEEVADFLVGLSGNGVSVENLELDTFSLENMDEAPFKTIKAYFPGDSVTEDLISTINTWLVKTGAAYPAYTYKPPAVTMLHEEDWANAWKQHFKPQRIGKRLIIKPTWEEFSARAGDIVLQIDPGRAFGTGTHPTTRLCLELLERIFAMEKTYATKGIVKPLSVLDVGTGSGVLSMAAARLGATRVMGIDIDPDAVEVAKENILLNRLEQTVQMATTPLDRIKESFDLLLANIIAEELVRLAPHLIAAINPGGLLVLSGILLEKSELVKNGYAGFPLELIEEAEKGEWCCLCYRLRG